MKKKLNLNDLKVESFVTNLEGESEKTIQGGVSGGACAPPYQKFTEDFGCLKTVFGIDCVYTKALCGGSRLC
ncbi:MAG: pinensin family lanthipeptide [Bacteroidota bacterium]